MTALLDPTVSRLSGQFPGIPTGVIESTVERCRQDLSEMPPGPLAELVERLASWRLSESND